MKLLLFILPLSLFAQLNIAVTYPYIGALTQEIGKENVSISALSRGNWDPHFVIPKPSLISKVRRADGLIVNGGELEIGWLSPLVNKAGNRKVHENSDNYLDLSLYVHLINKPAVVSRAGGDVHAHGNPHFHLDPQNILRLAHVIKSYLSTIDPAHALEYEQNFIAFKSTWEKKMKEWRDKMATKKGTKVIQYHDLLAYFTKAYELKTIGTLEPLPGIPPSSKHTFNLIKLIKKEKPSAILHDVYHSTKTAKYVADKTGIPLVVVPHDVGSLESVEDLTSLFDHLTSALK